jgi:hypothetical protein
MVTFEFALHLSQGFWLCMALSVPTESAVAFKLSEDTVTSCTGTEVTQIEISSNTAPQAPVVPPARALREQPIRKNLTPQMASEIKRLDALRVEIETNTPIARWQFDQVRACYHALLKAANGDPAAQRSIRLRLEHLARREQMARAAATIQAILAASHQRDLEIDELQRHLDIPTARRTLSREYRFLGFMQSSARKIDGQKLFVLIGKNGGTVAYLDIPPGLDPGPMVAHKVGVRGLAHFSEELQARLITVRDLQPIEAWR